MAGPNHCDWKPTPVHTLSVLAWYVCLSAGFLVVIALTLLLGEED